MSEKEKKTLPIISTKDLSKAENPILNEKQLNLLLSETPKNHIYERPAKGGGTWKYVTGIHVKKLLNLTFGWDWDFEVKQFEYNMEAKICMVLGRLTIRVKDRTIVKEQFGRSDIAFKTEPVFNDDGTPVMLKGKNGKEYQKKQPTNAPLDLGNDLKAATTDALKKCASELGFCSDIYGPDEFKNIRVADDLGENYINDLRLAISDKLHYCQDEELITKTRTELLDAEAKGENTVEFYREILNRFENGDN